jgi:transcriptional regulator with XRE-family HTH domain
MEKRDVALQYDSIMNGPVDIPLAADLLGAALRRVGSSVRDLRLAHGLSQEQAAKRAGLNQTRWSRVESGETARLEDLLAIQHLFGIESIESLLGKFPSRQLFEQPGEARPAA